MRPVGDAGRGAAHPLSQTHEERAPPFISERRTDSVGGVSDVTIETPRGVVLSNPCIEVWFVYHCANTCSSRTAVSACKELENKWKQGTYSKGMSIPEWLIDQTDDACSRVKHRRTSFAKGVTAWDAAPWSDMPELIAWLDRLRPRRSE